jgi:hypothetical protein
MNNIDNLERLNRLRESGALTKEEFEHEKNKLISGKNHIIKTSILKFSTILLILLLSVIALAIFIWSKKGKIVEIATNEAVAAGNVIDGPTLEAPPKNDPATVEKVNPAPLAFATSAEVLSLSPDYLEQRLGVPKEKNASFMVFEVGGCTILYGINKGSVTGFDVDVSKDCQPTINGIKVTPQTTYGQILSRETGGVYRASCLTDCGNAADPVVYLTYAGSRATGFIDVNYSTDYDQISSALDLWEQEVRKQLGLDEFESPDDYEAFQNVANPPVDVISLLSKARVRSVSMSLDL